MTYIKLKQPRKVIFYKMKTKRINYIFFFLFLFYLLNQFSFIFYNFSWFSLLCSLNLVDFYKTFNIFISSVYLYEYQIYVQQLHTYYNMNVDLISVRWFEFIPIAIDNLFLKKINFISDGSFRSFDFFYDFNNLHFDSIYCVYFDTKVIGNYNVDFYILQNKLFILPGETSLCFFRIYNGNSFSISGNSVYTVSPFELSSFVNKIQCFCFEEIYLLPFEVIELPVLFFLDSNISFLNFIDIKELCIEYVLLCNKI